MTLEIIAVKTGKDLRRFVDVPWQIYNAKDHPQWIPPLRMTVHDALDRKKPFYKDADRELFLAIRDGRVVGRIEQLFKEQHFLLLEKAGEAIADMIVREFNAPWVKISIAKLAPLRNVRKLGIVIERGKRA